MTFMIMSAVLAMFIDSITVILFLAAVTVELANLLKFDPVSMIFAEIFCANLGGSATMCGDPPNIIIGTSLGYSFGDFIASAFVDNIPFAATMIPVIKSLAVTQGVDLEMLAWTLSMGTDIGGSATPIGASANVVGISVAGKNGYAIGWGRYCKAAVPATILVVTVCMIYIFMRYC